MARSLQKLASLVAYPEGHQVQSFRIGSIGAPAQRPGIMASLTSPTSSVVLMQAPDLPEIERRIRDGTNQFFQSLSGSPPNRRWSGSRRKADMVGTPRHEESPVSETEWNVPIQSANRARHLLRQTCLHFTLHA